MNILKKIADLESRLAEMEEIILPKKKTKPVSKQRIEIRKKLLSR